ncbi:hypothetical protein Q1695_002872 [Nippostrongylus brasiliensis]|nr:hypothetical protein Q1695_002872 [Nippostrongylus brasiliensis]
MLCSCLVQRQSARRVFRKAAKLWQENTCIDIFEVKQATEAIRVVRKEGCWSSVGKTRGLQDLSLGKNCDTVGSAAHELGHALGFHHTQARFDRDKSIYVLSQNIKPNWFDQFTRETPATNYNYDLPYDYGSIMQYGATSATRNMRAKSPTMVPKDQRYLETLGSPFISFIDILMMNLHYNCTAKCNVRTAARCANYGFPHPRDCSRCICPGGYGGRLCDKKPGTCGKILRATSKQKVFTSVVGNKRAGGHPREDFSFCHYWIKAPAGKRVKVQLVRFTPRRIAVDGCKYGGVEFKAQKDQRLTGMRFCSPQDEGTILISESNLMPIITYNRIYASTITIRYSFV